LTKRKSMHRVRDRGTMMITMTPGCRKFVQKPPIGAWRPVEQRYYNYAMDDNGEPYGKDFVREVPRDQYHNRMVAKNDWIMEASPTPKPKAKAGGKQ